MNSIKMNNRGINVSVSVYIFKENDTYIAYCPSLDLSGYDTTIEKAKIDFEFMLSDYMKTQIQNGTLNEDLTNHGWKAGNTKTALYSEPKVEEMLSTNKQLQDVISLPEYSKINVESVCR